MMRGSRPWRLLAVGVLAAAVLAGCGRAAVDQGPSRAPASPSADPTAPATVQSDQLFFGRDIPGGGTVSDSEWTAFLAEVVTPRLPGGFVVWRTRGQWQTEDGSIAREASFVLRVDHPPGQPPDGTFEAIAKAYCRRFRQEAVTRLSRPTQKWLYGP